jgi:predicted Fe-Mo cluster-binding NifX family protein
MKYAFPCSQANWDEILDERFGRAPGFAIYDDEQDELKFIVNQEKDAGHGVGIQAGQAVVNAGAEVVFASGPVGPKAMQVLQQSGVKVYTDLGNISLKAALETVKK